MAQLAKSPQRALQIGCALAAAFALGGCPASVDDVRPPGDQFFYPTAMALSPDESTMFVVNANADLLYNTGSVTVVDLDALDALIAAPTGRDCDRDADRPGLWQCDESEAVAGAGDRGARIGNFANDIDVQDLGDGALRLFLTVRGDPSVTWIDYRGGQLECAGSEAIPLCDDDNRVLRFFDDPGSSLITGEPFQIYVDPDAEYAVVTHLINAAVSLIYTPRNGEPVLSDTLSGLFNASGSVQSSLGVAGRKVPGEPESLIYITSRSENRVYMAYVEDEIGPLPRLVPNQFFFLNSVTPSGNIQDSRGIAFGRDGARAYIVNRSPPALHVLDTSTTPTGQPKNEILTNVELCRDPAEVVVADTGRGERTYISCFPEGLVFVVDPELGVLDAVISVGLGPNGMAVDSQRQRLYVANYLEDTIAVVDINPDSETANEVVLKLGRPKQLGDN